MQNPLTKSDVPLNTFKLKAAMSAICHVNRKTENYNYIANTSIVNGMEIIG